jgi:hypothetical protein
MIWRLRREMICPCRQIIGRRLSAGSGSPSLIRLLDLVLRFAAAIPARRCRSGCGESRSRPTRPTSSPCRRTWSCRSTRRASGPRARCGVFFRLSFCQPPCRSCCVAESEPRRTARAAAHCCSAAAAETPPPVLALQDNSTTLLTVESLDDDEDDGGEAMAVARLSMAGVDCQKLKLLFR